MWRLSEGGAYSDLGVNSAILIREQRVFKAPDLLEEIWYVPLDERILFTEDNFFPCLIKMERHISPHCMF